MIRLMKSTPSLGRTLRSGVAALMLAGVFAGAAASPALANGWGHGPVGHGHVGHGYGGWHGGWYPAGYFHGWYGRPFVYGYPGYYGYVAPPAVYAAPIPGVAISVPLVVR